VIARLLICPDVKKIQEDIQKTLALRFCEAKRKTGLHLEGVNLNHPDILYFKTGEKLGIAESRKIKEHFCLKPFSAKGRVVILEDISPMTLEAQNALLKTIEELPNEALLILGTNSDANLLPTILSRCEIKYLDNTNKTTYPDKYQQDLEKILTKPIWFGWVDDDPQAFFEHETRYVFIDARTGEYTIETYNWWPVVNGESLWMNDEEKENPDVLIFSTIHLK